MNSRKFIFVVFTSFFSGLHSQELEVAQQAYVKASNQDSGDQFGYSIAFSGNTMVVGAPFEDSSATTVNGDEDDDSASSGGAAYVFIRDATGNWTQQAYLKASNTDPDDQFGYSVAILGDTIVVGAIREEGSGTGVNSQDDNNTFNVGAAYVFERMGMSWSQTAYLKPIDTGGIRNGENFGTSVAVNEQTIIVGAPGRRFNRGAAYVFGRSGTSWVEDQALLASDGSSNHQFGESVAITNDTVALIGAWGYSGLSGAAYVFKKGQEWEEQTILRASNPDGDDRFGYSVSICGDTAAVGSFWEDSSAEGVNGDENDNSLQSSGAAYVFRESESGWNQEAYLKSPASELGARFGYAVDVFEDVVAVGSPQADNDISVQLFQRNETNWTPLKSVVSSHITSGDFGWSLAIRDQTLVIGAPNDSSSAIGINGEQSDTSSSQSGAAFVFDLDAEPIKIKGTSLIGNQFTIDFSGDANVTNWRFKGSQTLSSFEDSLTPFTVVTETSPGFYQATLDLSGIDAGSYFLRIER